MQVFIVWAKTLKWNKVNWFCYIVYFFIIFLLFYYFLLWDWSWEKPHSAILYYRCFCPSHIIMIAPQPFSLLLSLFQCQSFHSSPFPLPFPFNWSLTDKADCFHSCANGIGSLAGVLAKVFCCWLAHTQAWLHSMLTINHFLCVNPWG